MSRDRKWPSSACAVTCVLFLAKASIVIAQPATDESELAETKAAIVEAIEKFNAGRYRRAVRELDKVIESDEFSRLPDTDRRNALSNSGWIRLLLDQDQEAHREFVTLTSMSNASGDDWMGRMTSAYRIEDFADAAASLVEISASFPITFDQIVSADIHTLLTALEDSPERFESYLLLMEALVSAAWKTAAPGRSSGWYWKYTLAMLERGMVDSAIKAVELIRFAPDLVSMRIDRRFDAVVSARPELFDVHRAMQSEIDAWREYVADAPGSAEAVYRLSGALMRANRPEETIDLISEALLRGDQIPNSLLPRLLNRRSDSFWLLGMFDEAIADLERAINEGRRRGGGGSVNVPLEFVGGGRRYVGEPLEVIGGRRLNVSQSLNLAQRYALLGRVDEARRLVLGAEGVNEYGEMMKRYILVLIAVYEGDERAVRREVMSMRRDEGDAPGLVQSALIFAGNADAALDLLQRRLEDPDERRYALLEAQEYAVSDEELTEFGRQLELRRGDFYRILAVRSAISTYGRLESLDISLDRFYW